MKKTKHSLLTALTFTAALQMASTSNVNAVTENEINAIGVQKNFDASSQVIQDVYGPAPDYRDDPVTTDVIETAIAQTTTQIITTYGPPVTWSNVTTTTDTSTSTSIETTTAATTSLYGPPRAYYTCDLNNDDSIDVFDVIYLRKMLLKNMEGSGYFGAITLDVNRDGEFGVADLVAMQNYILGRIPDLTTPVSTSTATTTDTTTTTPNITDIDIPTTTRLTTVPLYGAPLDFTTTTIDPTLVQLMYGPPQTRTWDTSAWTTTTTASTTKKPRKTTTTTSAIKTTTTTEQTTTFDPSVTTVQLMYGPPEYFGLDPDTLKPKE